MAETINGLYKAEVIHRMSSPTLEPVELAQLEWVSWFIYHRLLEPPDTSYRQKLRPTTVGNSPVSAPRWGPDLIQSASTIPRAIHIIFSIRLLSSGLMKLVFHSNIGIFDESFIPPFPGAIMAMSNKLIVRAFVKAINEKDWERLRVLLAPDFRRHSVAAGEPGVRTAEELIYFLMAEYQTFPDSNESVLDIVAEGDRVAVRHRFLGTQLGQMGPYEASGKVLDATYLAIYRIEEGRIVESWAEWDNLAGLKQLGHHGTA